MAPHKNDKTLCVRELVPPPFPNWKNIGAMQTLAACPLVLLMLLFLENTEVYCQSIQVMKVSKAEKTGSVLAMRFSSDGKKLATAWGDKLIVWEAGSGKRLATLSLPDVGLIWSVAFTPDGARIAFTSNTMSPPRLWTVRAENATCDEFRGHNEWVKQAEIIGNGKILVSADVYCNLKLWDLSTKKEISTLAGSQPFFLSCLACSPDGKIVAGGGGKTLGMPFGEVRLWNLETHKPLPSIKGHEKMVTCISFSSDGALLASGSEDVTVRLWEVKSGKLRATMNSELLWISSVALCADKRLMAIVGSRLTETGDETGALEVWDLQTKSIVFTQRVVYTETSSRCMGCVAFSPDGRFMAVPLTYTEVHILDVSKLTRQAKQK